MREYKNFKQIDRDLKLLKLQQEIDKEKILLNYNRTKESLTPKNLLKSAADAALRNPVVLAGTTKVLSFIGNKFR